MPGFRKRLLGGFATILKAWKFTVARAGVAAALLVAQPAVAEELTLDTDRSLAELEAELSAQGVLQGLDAVALGAVSFLRAIEVTLQERYRTGAAPGESMVDIPVFRLSVPANPQPEPFQPDLIASIFSSLSSDMEETRAHLIAAELGPEDRLILDIAALWFDIDGNGSRSAGEGVLEVAGVAVGGAFPGETADFPVDGLVVHFDAADVEWLLAYTHLLSALSDVVLAFDPTEIIADVMASNAVMAEARGGMPLSQYNFLSSEAEFIDAFATVYGALNRVPEQARIASARDHLMEMIARNRLFWALVDQETDNAFEWIPNASQAAALGFSLLPETSKIWLKVLADAEAVLKGELLVSHWRTEPGGGVNVAKLIADPPEVDIVTWIQGSGLAPYMESGPLASWESFNRFSALFRGDAVLFMVLLN